MTPELPLQDGVRAKIFKAFVAHLQQDMVLSKVVRLWDDYSGRAEDFRIVPLEQTPAIRFGIGSAPMSPDTFASHSASFRCDIELIVAGTNQFDIVNLWEAVEEAASPFLAGDMDIRKRIGDDRRAVFGTHFFSSSAVNHAKYTNPPCMVGTGSVTFVLSIRR
ncbi:hypothetical protein UFOVP142_36 [uncultured Caudovirales phage]|uniref:Uncharacterized protein n=1 Tax=uncultured Caudovirales phage TaxID=2100421 RepID=A0A6J7XNV9_9CAUD|nr:hypothetical protein UFOVP142_36 [uncultured Caudovirales phage]